MHETRTTTHRLHASDRRQQLLEAALDLFAQKGFEGATTKEIAAAAGVTEAIVFRHFPNKQALHTAVLAYKHQSPAAQAFFAETQALIDRNDDVGLCRAIIRIVIENYRRDARYQRLLLFAALEGNESALAYHRQQSLPFYELLCQYIERRQREGAIRPGPPGMVLCAAAGMATQYAMMTELFGFETPESLEEVTRAFTEIVANGIFTGNTK